MTARVSHRTPRCRPLAHHRGQVSSAGDEEERPGQRYRAALRQETRRPGPQLLTAGKGPIRTSVRPVRRVLLLLSCCTLGSNIRISLLTCGAKGTRTPDPLLANNRQGVHRCPSPLVSVVGRPFRSAPIRTRCGTSVLYSALQPGQPRRAAEGCPPAPLADGTPASATSHSSLEAASREQSAAAPPQGTTCLLAVMVPDPLPRTKQDIGRDQRLPGAGEGVRVNAGQRDGARQ